MDIGGTFTDVVLLDARSGRVVVDKTLTTPAARWRACAGAWPPSWPRPACGPARSRPHRPRHHADHQRADPGTDRAGGARDDAASATPCSSATSTATTCTTCRSSSRSPVPDRTFELAERTAADGRVLTAPSEADLDAARAELDAVGAEAVAVCFSTPTSTRPTSGRWRHLQRRLGVPVCIRPRSRPRSASTPDDHDRLHAATMPVIGPYLDGGCRSGWRRRASAGRC